MSSCPTCDRTFANETSMKIHHTKAHGESLVEQPDGPECPTCGDSFATSNAMKVHHSKAHGESISGERVECSWCGEEHRRIRYEIERSDNLFCSKECYTAHRRESWQGEGHPRYRQVELVCEWCEESFSAKHSMKDDRRFCSKECLAASQAEHRLSGEDHPNWKGGKSPSKTTTYGLGWNESKREAVRERDNRECQGCGLASEDNKQKFGVKLHVHHIVPVTEFDEPKERNAMTNLISLCSRCHPVWERMAPLRPEITVS